MWYRRAAPGFTFIEVLVALLVLAIIVFGVNPQLTSGNPQRLDVAASQIAAAIRFARSEAMRTGDVHAVFVDELNETITVELTELSTKPASVKKVLYHPIDKRPYTFNLSENSATQDVFLDSPATAFLFANVGNQQRLMFTADGVPVFIDTVTNTVNQLVAGEVLLGMKGLGAVVSIQPITGRVTLL
jgi:prepilin-type N-terminal cleavage/methylation domain-containing protein